MNLAELSRELTKACNLQDELDRTISISEDMSKVIAALVLQHGGDINQDIWDKVHRQPEFISYGLKRTHGKVIVTTGFNGADSSS